MQSALLLRQGTDHHDHLTAFHFGHVFDFAQFGDVTSNPFQQFAAQILVRHLATPEAQRDLYLVAVFQEFVDIAHFDFVVMRVGVGPEFDLFHLNDLLLFARFAFAFLLFIFELAEIHDFANRGIGVRRNLDQIKTDLFCHLHSAGRCNHPDIFTFSADQADFI